MALSPSPGAGAGGRPGFASGSAAQLARDRQRREGLCPAYAPLELDPALTAALTDPDRVWETARPRNLTLAREAHACTHTTFSPNVACGGSKINVIPDRVEIDVDIRAPPGVESHEVEAMLSEALGDLAGRVTIEPPSNRRRGGSVSPFDTPLVAALTRVVASLIPGSRMVPALTTGGTDAKFFRWRGIPS